MIERLPVRYAWTPDEPAPPEYRPTRKLVFESRLVLGNPAALLWVEEQRGQEITTVEGSCYLAVPVYGDVAKHSASRPGPSGDEGWALRFLRAVLRAVPESFEHLRGFMPVEELLLEEQEEVRRGP